MKELLGSKGSGLAEMARLGLRVPAGFTVSTRCCERYEQSGMDFVRRELWEEVLDGVAFIEKTTKRTVFRSGCSLCGVSELIHRKFVKGYVSHKNRVVVLSKIYAFPKISDMVK